MNEQKVIRTDYPDGSTVLSNIRNNKEFPFYTANDTVTATKVTKWYDDSDMSDAKVDGKVYLKHKTTGEYFRINLPNFGESFLEKDTMSDMRALTVTEILLLKMGYYKGVRLNGYYEKGDTPAPIEYFLSETLEEDDGGSVFEVGGIKLKHEFVVEVNVVYFGAVNGGDNTASFQNTLNYSYDNGKVMTTPDLLSSNISDSLLLKISGEAQDLNIKFGTNNKINITSDEHIGRVIYVKNTEGYNVNVLGSGLVVNINNKAASFITVEANNALEEYGEVVISDITVKNTFKPSSYSVEAIPFFVIGAFTKAYLTKLVVDSVDYEVGASGNEAKGICVTDFVGEAYFLDCIVNNVMTQSGGDADGYACFSRWDDTNKTLGKARFINCSGKDNQGRHIKSQCSDTEIIGGTFERELVNTITQGCDFDMQAGNGLISDVVIKYKNNSLGQSPLGTSFTTVVFQNKLSNDEKASIFKNSTIYTEVIIPRVVLSINGGRHSSVFIYNIIVLDILSKVVGSNSINRSFLEFIASDIADAGSDGLSLTVKNINVNSTSPLIGYTGLASDTNLESKLSIIANSNENKLSSTSWVRLSGAKIIKAYINFSNNSGFNTYLEDGYELDLEAIPPNTEISFAIEGTVLTNAPEDLPATGYTILKSSGKSATGWIYKELNVNGGQNIYGNISGTWNTIK